MTTKRRTILAWCHTGLYWANSQDPRGTRGLEDGAVHPCAVALGLTAVAQYSCPQEIHAGVPRDGGAPGLHTPHPQLRTKLHLKYFSKFQIGFFKSLNRKQDGSVAKYYPSRLALPAVLPAEKFYLAARTISEGVYRTSKGNLSVPVPKPQ